MQTGNHDFVDIQAALVPAVDMLRVLISIKTSENDIIKDCFEGNLCITCNLEIAASSYTPSQFRDVIPLTVSKFPTQ